MGRVLKRALRCWPLAAAAAALAVHLLIAFLVDVPGVFQKYPRAASQYLTGMLPEERLMDLSPLYFELAVAATRLAPAHPERPLRALQMALVALASGFLAQLLARRFGRGVAALGWLAFVCDRHVLVYERILEPEACLVFLVAGCLFFVDRGRGGALVAGCLAGVSLLARPTFLPLFALVPLHLKWQGARWTRSAALFAAPVAAALALLMARAAAVTGDPWTPVMSPGTVFYEGNNALSHGTSAVYPPVVRELIGPAEERPDIAHEHYRTVAGAAAGEELSIVRVNAYWSALAAATVRDAPGRWLGLVGEKLRHAFHGYRWHDVTLAWRYDRALGGSPSVPFALLAALALVGMALEARRWRPAMLFYALAGLQLAVMLVFYVSARQRLVWLPALIYFAAAAVERLREGGRRLPLAAGVLLLALCFAVPDDRMRDDRYLKSGSVAAQARFQELAAAARDEPLAAHVDLALDALRHAPWVEWVPAYFPQMERSADARLAELLAADAARGGNGTSAAFDRAVVFLRAGRLAEAAALMGELAAAEREVYRGGQQASQPRFYLARIAAREGDRERAVRLLEEALARAPGDPFVLAELWVLTGDPRHRERLLRLHGPIDARYLAGRALFFHGRYAEAAAELADVVARLPELRTGRIYLAAALGATGRVDEGAAQYLEAVRRQPDPLLLSAPISELFRRWAALHPEDPRTRLLAAHVLHEHGRFREGLALLASLETPPGDLREAAAEEARRLRRALDAAASTAAPNSGGT